MRLTIELNVLISSLERHFFKYKHEVHQKTCYIQDVGEIDETDAGKKDMKKKNI